MHASYLLAGARFEAARQLPADWFEPQFASLHGHSFRVQLRVENIHTNQAGLAETLQRAVQPLHYASLNQRMAAVDDLAIAEHLSEQLSFPHSLTLTSAPERGVILDNGTRLVWLNAGFEAAHQLPHVPAGHKCGRLHGHGFGVRLVADAASANHVDLAAAWGRLFLRLNHRYLNDIPGLANPTSEVLAQWIYRELSADLAGLAWVEVRETHTAGSQFDGRTFRIWKEQHFESAVPFDADGNYTGHSYLIRLMLQGELDGAMGWLLDFGDVKDRFKPVYRQLDHNPLDRLAGIRNGHPASVAEWVHAELSPLVPELARVDLMERDERGVSVLFKDNMRWPLL